MIKSKTTFSPVATTPHLLLSHPYEYIAYIFTEDDRALLSNDDDLRL